MDIKLFLISLNRLCNLKCKYCSIWQLNDDRSLNFDIICKYIDWFSELFPNRTASFFSAEPLLDSDYLNIIKYSLSKSLKFDFITNGTLIDEKTAYEIGTSGVSNITISLDSHIKEINQKMRGVDWAYDKALQAIYYLKQYDINVNIASILCNDTIDTVLDFCDFCDSLECNPAIIPLNPDFPFVSGILNLKMNEGFISDLNKLNKKLLAINKRYPNIMPIDYLNHVMDYHKKVLYGKKYFTPACEPKTLILSRDESLMLCPNFMYIKKEEDDYNGIKVNSFEEFKSFITYNKYERKIRECPRYCSIKECMNKYLDYF